MACEPSQYARRCTDGRAPTSKIFIILEHALSRITAVQLRHSFPGQHAAVLHLRGMAAPSVGEIVKPSSSRKRRKVAATEDIQDRPQFSFDQAAVIQVQQSHRMGLQAPDDALSPAPKFKAL